MGKIVLNGNTFSYSGLNEPLTVHDEFSGSLVVNDLAPLLYGKLAISYDMTGLAPTNLTIKRFKDDLLDKTVQKISLRSDEMGILPLDDVFFDSIEIDDNFDSNKVCIYFSGYKLRTSNSGSRLLLAPIANAEIYSTLLDFGSGGNTKLGQDALKNDDGTDNKNVAFGDDALMSNIVGSKNVGVGYGALMNCIASKNSAVGYMAMALVTSGFTNSAFGHNCLPKLTTGYGNTAMGNDAGVNLITGLYNLIMGLSAFGNATSGNFNVLLGLQAALKDSAAANVTSLTDCVIMGAYAKPKTTGDTDEIVIGANAVGNGSGTTTVGNANTTETFLKGALRVEGGELKMADTVDGKDYKLEMVNGVLTPTEIV